MEDLKFKRTEFLFKNKVETENFFNKELVHSVDRFIKSHNNYALEYLHILYSWAFLLKYSAFTLLLIDLKYISERVAFPVILGISIIFIIAHLYVKYLFRYADRILQMLNFLKDKKLLEEVRNEIINK